MSSTLSLDQLLPLVVTALWAMSSLPVAYAEKVCHTHLGGTKCKDKLKLSKAAKIAIVVTILAIMSLAVGVYLLIKRSRSKKAAAAAAEAYNVEANQIKGPTTTYAANYDINSAPGMYTGPGTAPTMYAGPGGTPHTYPNPYEGQPQTAPTTITYASTPQSYPFAGYSSQAPPPNSPYLGGNPAPVLGSGPVAGEKE